MRKNLFSPLELLLYDVANTLLVGLLDHPTPLGAENVVSDSFFTELTEFGERLHQLYAVGFVLKPFVHFQEGDDVSFLPKEVCRRHSFDLAAHGTFEENHTDDLARSESRRSNHPSTHLVNEIEHLLFGLICIGLDTVCLQSFRGRATTLIQCSYKAGSLTHLLQLFFVHCLFILIRLAK